MVASSEGKTRTRARARRGLWVTITLVLIVGALLIERATRMTPYVRDQAVAALNAKFASQVELGSLQVSVFPRPAVIGEGVVLRYNGRTDVLPLLAVRGFSSTAGMMGLWRKPLRLNTLDLDGLDIRIPAGGLNPVSPAEPDAPRAGRVAPPRPTTPPSSRGSQTILIDRVVAREATLEIASKDSTKLPRRFEIHNLDMAGLGDGAGSQFRARITNPKPRGDIDTSGTFGPWQTDNPRLTPIHGDYTLNGADLNTIKGIGGILDSAGSYRGVLERIDVTGRTETPDFRIDTGGQAVPLTTRFHAVVDGTNGNTWLERVEARLRNTIIIARGAVVRAKDVKGREISLDVAIENGRLEDLLALAIEAVKPPMTGDIRIKTHMVIPAGEESVIDKLELAGEFELAQARFSNLNVQNRINTLSRKGQGDPAGADEGESAVSNLRARFVMRNAAIQFSRLTFAVEGAIVQLAGGYHLRSEAIDFSGELLLDASLAEMTTGVRSIAARIAQPFFRRPGGGSKIPIRISGTRTNPSFGMDVKRAFLPG